MALFGSAAANLSPIFFRGDIFGDGVNIIIHNDITQSMNIYPYGVENYTTTSEFSPARGAETDVELNSIFYDGSVIEQLQRSLVGFGVGVNENESPNIYTYIDADLRQRQTEPGGAFEIQIGGEISQYSKYFIKGVNPTNLRSTWNTYIALKPGLFNDTNPITNANKVIPTVRDINALNPDTDIELRFTGAVLDDYKYSEDVHGFLASLYYLTNTVTVPNNRKIETGYAGIFGKELIGDKFRKNNKTFVITASNEQENAPPNMVGVGFSVTDNAIDYSDPNGLEINRSEFSQSGLYVQRYWHYYLDNGMSDYGGFTYITSGNLSVDNFVNTIVDPNPLRDRIRLGFNQLIRNSSLQIQSETVNLTEVFTNDSGDDDDQFFHLNKVYTSDTASGTGIAGVTDYWNPNSPAYTPFFIGNNQTEQFGKYFDLIAIKWPTGSITVDNTQIGGNFPGDVNPRDFSSIEAYAQTFISAGNLIETDDIINSPGIVYRDQDNNKQTLLDPSGNDTSEGVIVQINELRSEIPNHSIMIFGYFVPQETGNHTFRLDSNEISMLWFGEDAVSRDDEGVSDWTGTNASLRTKTVAVSELVTNQYGAGQLTGYNAGDGQFTINLIDGKYYPIRILGGNRGDWIAENATAASNGWQDGSWRQGAGAASADGYNDPDNSGASNPSTLTLSFNTPSNPATFRTDGTGFFFGGEKVSQPGSEFVPATPKKSIRTLNEELNFRNISVIAISNYESPESSLTKNYDGVFFPSNSSYQYVKFISDTEYEIDPVTTTAPDWLPSQYFKDVPYLLKQSDGDIQLEDVDTMFGTGLELTVNKDNSQYKTTIISSNANYKIGDRVVIDSSTLGEQDVVGQPPTTLTLEVTSVSDVSYFNVQANNIVESGDLGSGAEFSVVKTTFSGGNYTLGYDIALVNGGTNFEVGDTLLILGSLLDGTLSNDITITVDEVDAGGVISLFSFTGTPTNLIVYGKNPIGATEGENLGATYKPQNINSISYERFDVSSIGYDHFNVVGISYTTITDAQIAGIAYSVYPAANVSFASTALIESIEYIAPTITAIGYSAPQIVSIGYTTANITDIRYPKTNSFAASGIGYTTPPIVSIGHTSVEIVGIAWTTALKVGIATEPSGPNDTQFSLATSEVGLGKTIGLVVGDRIIFDNTNPPEGEGTSLERGYDEEIFTVTSVLDNYSFTVNYDSSGGGTAVQTFPFGSDDFAEYICISKEETDLENLSGISSYVQFTSSTPHPFVSGDSVISYGTISQFSGTEFRVKDVLSNTVFTLEGIESSPGTTTVETFTGSAGISTLISSTVRTGYFTSSLEIQFKTTTESIGITSISYDLTDDLSFNNISKGIESRYFFDIIRNRGNVGNLRTIGLRIDDLDSVDSLDNLYNIGDEIYVFGASELGGPSGIDFNSVNSEGDVIGYAHTITNVSNREILFNSKVTDFGDPIGNTNDFGTLYVIPKNSLPVVNHNLNTNLKDNDIINITGNENPVYNKSFKVTVGTGFTNGTLTLNDFNTGSPITTEEILTPTGIYTASNGNISLVLLTDSGNVRVGDGDVIDTFNNSVYNLDSATLTSIGNTDDYRFNISNGTYPLNSTPTELDLGFGGNAGIQNISGIVTSNAHNFGSSGDTIQLRVYNTSTGFDKNYTNSVILDANRILLGADSVNPRSFYDPDSNAYNPPESGKIFLLGSDPIVTIDRNYVDIGITNTSQHAIQDVSDTAFNGPTRVFRSVSGNTAEIELGVDPIDPDTNPTDGLVGVRNSPPTVTVKFGKTLQDLGIGQVGDTAIVDIQDTGVVDFNGNNKNITIYGPDTFSLDNEINPTDYTISASTGLVGLKAMPGIGTIAGNLQTLGFGDPGSTAAVRIQNTSEEFDNSDVEQTIRIYSDTEFGLENFQDPADHSVKYVGSSAVLGLQNTPPTVTIIGNLISLGFGGFIGDTFNSRVLYTNAPFNGNNNNCEITSATTFTLVGDENPTNYTSNYTNVGDTDPGLCGRRGTSLILTTDGPHEFKNGDTIRLQDTVTNRGSTSRNDVDYVISDVTSTTANLGVVLSNTGEIESSTNGVAGLRDFPATVRLNIDIPDGIIDGSSVKFENTGVTNFNGNKTVSNFDYGRRLFTITGTDNPADFNTSSSSSIDRIIGLNAIPTLEFESSSFGLSGPEDSITLYGVTDTNTIGFNQQFTSFKVYSNSPTTKVGLLLPDLSLPSTFVNTNAGSGGVVGLDNKDRILITSNPAPFNTGDSIKIINTVVTDSGITGDGSEDFNGTFTVTKESDTVYRLNSTSLNNQPNLDTTYDDVAATGYIVGVSSNAKVTLNNHRFETGFAVEISGTSQDYFNSSPSTRTVIKIDDNNFYLNNTNTPPSDDYTIISGSVGVATLISGAGSGARFTVTRQLTSSTSARYSGIATAYPRNSSTPNWVQGGQGYRVDDILTIPGNLLGGVTPANNCNFRVAHVTQNSNPGLPNYDPVAPVGRILSLGNSVNNPSDGLSQGNTADPALDYSDENQELIPFDAEPVSGTGSGALFNVTRNGTEIYDINLANGGTGYVVNDILGIDGETVGGITGVHDIEFVINPDGVNASGTIAPTGFSNTGIASLSNPVSGLNTVSGEPIGLEDTGTNLNQTHNMLDVAEGTRGGLFKINNIYRKGEFTKYVNPILMYWPAVTNHNYGEPGTDGAYKGSLFFDTFGASGIATVTLDDDSNNEFLFVDFEIGDKVFIFGTGSNYVDFDKVGYGLTIVGIDSSTSNQNYGPNGAGNNDNYNPIANDRFGYISFLTSNRRSDDNNWQENIVNDKLINGTGGDERQAFLDTFGETAIDGILRTDVNSGPLPVGKRGFNGGIIKGSDELRVYAPGHGFTDGEEVTVLVNTNAGLSRSTYTVRLEPYLRKNLYSDIDQSGTQPYTLDDIVSELNIGGENHFRLEGFTAEKYLPLHDFSGDVLTQSVNSVNENFPPNGPYNFIISGGNDSDGLGNSSNFDSEIWNPNIGNGQVLDDDFDQSLEARLAKAIVSYNPIDNTEPGIYVGISTVDSRIAFAKATSEYISKNN